MAGHQPGRLRAVLKLAQRREESALRDAAATDRKARDADAAAQESQRELDEMANEAPTTAAGLRQHRQRAELRAHKATLADQALRDMLLEQLEAREELRGAIRRRRSLEELEARRLATQAGMAAHAAQRALDELAAMRRRTEGGDRP